MALPVVGEERRNADRAGEVIAGRDPAPPGVVLLPGIDDADDGALPGKAEAEVTAPPHVADERLDLERRPKRLARERLESGGVGRKQRG